MYVVVVGKTNDIIDEELEEIAKSMVEVGIQAKT